MSTGLGPFYASSSLGGNRRRTSTRRTTRSRTVAPSAAQLNRARRQAERAQQEAERDAAISQLRELKRQMTSVHLDSFPAAHPPAIPDALQLSLSWALAEARTFRLQGVGRLARAERLRPSNGRNWANVLSMTGIATAVVLLVTVLSLLRLMRPDGLRTE
ncbi:hypothetical protein ACWDAG_43115 [Streptomyces sp. NPDC001157]